MTPDSETDILVSLPASLNSFAQKSRIDRLHERLFPARLVQESHGTGFKRSAPGLIVAMGCDENNWEPRIGGCQVPLKIQSIHARHPHVENQTIRIVQVIRIEEFLGRRETLGPEA
jgi:hypothetical protein